MERKKASSCVVVLQNSVTIEQAESIKKQFLSLIKKYKKSYVDISNVTDIDSSIVQLILSAKLEATNNNKEFLVTGIIPNSVHNLLNTLSITLPEQNVEVANV